MDNAQRALIYRRDRTKAAPAQRRRLRKHRNKERGVRNPNKGEQ